MTAGYASLGSCAYCGGLGTAKQPLTKEHIIPYGLGGNLALPKSSCTKCQIITSDLERLCLRKMFGSVRIALGLGTRRPHKRPTHLSMLADPGEPEEREILIPASGRPLFLALWNFGTPKLLGGDHDDVADIWMYGNSLDGLSKFAGQHRYIGLSVNTDSWTTCRLLGKIAHTYAVAEYGNDAFTPLLVDLILNKGDIKLQPMELIGANRGRPNDPGVDCLHELSLHTVSHQGLNYVVAKIRLFAMLGSPTYTVIVGRSNQSSLPNKAVVIRRH